MEKNWMLNFYSHPPVGFVDADSIPADQMRYSASLDFDNGEIIQVFYGTEAEAYRFLDTFCRTNEISEDDQPKLINIVELA